MELESDVPLPPQSAKALSYPLLYTMNVGQSFVRPIEEYTRLHAASQTCRRSTGRRFAIRKLDPTHIRIWRIE